MTLLAEADAGRRVAAPHTDDRTTDRGPTLPKISVSIPYRRRLHNLGLVLESLARQTMDRAEFEVVVGAMEYAEEYVDLCRRFTDRLDIVSVVSSREFHIPHARNLAMRQASGEIVVQMDADTLLPPDALRNLYDRHFAFGQRVCVVGQVVGYGNNNDGDVTSIEPLPYDAHLANLDAMAAAPDWPADPRFQVDHVIPWAFGWTGLIALPRALVREHRLYFDESFRGWGVDDLEWSYRVCASGTPIVLRPDVYALHLPHLRDTAANRVTETANYRRFLRKWPGPDVELAHAIGDVEANARYLEFRRELRAVGEGRPVGTLRGRVAGRSVLVVGAALDPGRRPVDPAVGDLFDDGAAVEALPLAGLALPYDEGEVDEARVLPAVGRFSAGWRDAVAAEAARVARRVTWVGEPG
ncbi:glycosyltransferase [Micromonospora sp. NPDC018662]|uniref:glycosyltransferase n=1 Tax=Micromonospora sp. NPDC018662 TaxID=3364238 RepID=UPI0037BCD397